MNPHEVEVLSPHDLMTPDEVQDLLGDLLAQHAPPPAVVDGSRQTVSVPYELQKVNHTHHAIMDHMIAYPTDSMKAIAERFGYTQAWLSTLVHSDVFQRELTKRRAAWRNVHDARLAGQITDVAEKALKRLSDVFDEEDAVSPKAANEIAKTALSALGFVGGKPSEQASVVNNTYNISAEDLHLAQQIMMKGTA